MGLPSPDIQPDTDWRWVAHAAWNHAQSALNRISSLEERLEALELQRKSEVHQNGAMSCETFTYVDPTEGICSVTVTPDDPLILKNSYFVRANSPEAEPLLAQWARLKLGLL